MQMTNNNFTTVFGDSQLYLDNESAFISFSGSELYMDDTEVTLTGANGAYVTANYNITNTDNTVTIPSIGRCGSTITLEADG